MQGRPFRVHKIVREARKNLEKEKGEDVERMNTLRMKVLEARELQNERIINEDSSQVENNG